MTALQTHVATTRHTREFGGRICLWGGLVGLAQAIVILVWPSPVVSSRYSAPFHPTGFTIAQLTFCAQHLSLAVGLCAVLRVPQIRARRSAFVGASVALAGMLLLAGQELVAISAAHVAENSSRGNLIDSLYAGPIFLIAIGCLVAGLVSRARPSRSVLGWLPTLLIVIGVYAFVPLTPAIAGPEAAGRIAIGGWMLLFAALGGVLAHLSDGFNEKRPQVRSEGDARRSASIS
jgi:hypothetical protein